jgi:hypothetical protein
LHVSMRTRKRNAGVAIMANTETKGKPNAEAADGSSKDSYAAVAASPPRITRSNRAAITRIQGDNTDVAANTPAARDTEAKPPSPPAPATGGAPAEVSPTRKTPARTGQEASPASSGNDGVADEASGKLAKPPSPPAPTPPGAAAEEVVALLAEKDAEIAALKAQVEKPMTKAQVDKHKEEPKKKAARITMSTEAAGVPEDSKKYWVDVGAKKKKDTNVLVKSGAKPDSRTGLHWPGYCVEGCGCDVCVAKREEPSKTAMLNLKRVSKKPST